MVVRGRDERQVVMKLAELDSNLSSLNTEVVPGMYCGFRSSHTEAPHGGIKHPAAIK